MSLSVYVAFLLATLVVVVVPGPTNTLIVANSVRHGRRAGLLNVAGTQLGLAITVGLVLLGLTSLIELGPDPLSWRAADRAALPPAASL